MMTNTVKWMSRRSTRSAGFTLIEILLVIVIILLLAGALVVFVLPQQEGAERTPRGSNWSRWQRRSIRIG